MAQERSEMPLFTKTYDFLLWLTPAVQHFPKLHRQTITRRLLEAALDFQEAILEADSRRGRARLEYLTAADAHLKKVRIYLRLVHRLAWIGDGQYEHAAGMVAEMGRLLGGWRRVT
ncbi:MAG: diversity-generating retroelement protein Avd [Caldilineaceae bacterium]|nr:diversity-generating retroelement protein Avd [Caldilineaceae bacterium]